MDQVEKRGDDEIEVAIKEGYLKTYSHFLEQDTRGGSCCVTALIRKGNLVVSNAGDCRAVVSRNGVAEAPTSDIVPHERTRSIGLSLWVDMWNASMVFRGYWGPLLFPEVLGINTLNSG
ncbi:hypothetical protein Leryth_022823 [Lithospermum erythrorhizon]|nr:hypothetical protein Leryth_022823 [Lithospermum erythrorhizon]